MNLGRLETWIGMRQRAVVYFGGAMLVSAWTLLRFFARPTIFDQVTQQVIVRQWLSDNMSTAHMGQTAYVVKMLVLYTPLDMLPGSPRLKLILPTLIINIATFIFIGLVAEQLLRLYRVRVGWALHLALLWFAGIAGSVFWISFANSRNLEVAGGLFLLLLGLRWLQVVSWRTAAGVVALGGLLFFDDPLQLYMTAVPLVMYTAVLAVTGKVRRQRAIGLVGLLVVAYITARLLGWLAARELHASFVDTGGVTKPGMSLHWLAQSTVGTAHAFASLLAGSADAGRLREVINVTLLLAGIAGAAYAAVRRHIPGGLLLFVGCVFAVDAAVFAASGQAVQGAANARYLIMTAPALLLLFGAVQLPKTYIRSASFMAAGLIAVGAVLLVAALAKNWNTAFPHDAHLASVHAYVQGHPGTKFYASIDTALPVQYLYRVSASKLLPLGCDGHRLVRTYFSTDKEFAARGRNLDATVAIILDGGAIASTPNVCSQAAITDLLGAPQRTAATSDGSAVLYYRQAALRL